MTLEQGSQPIEPIGMGPSVPTGNGGTPWGLADVLKAIGLVILGSIAILIPAAVAVAIIDQPDSDAETLASLTPSLALEVLLLLVAIRFTIGKYRCSWRDLGFRPPARGGWWLPPVLVVGAWITVVIYFVIVNTLGAGRLEDQRQFPEESFESPAILPVIAILALVAAPITEEVFFRGFVFGALRRRWGLLAATLASGLLFGLAHFLPILYIPFGLIGVLFALGYVYSGSLWVPMAAHFLFNSISFAVSVAMGGG